ncbi:hypothetical protein [Streptomyces sp. NPDC047061]|uniref:hypothetical protein n=1 Tax=Streptomyces sp. NPDC047061 TaxID=3154605 RepID=UPI00340231B9
MNAESGPGDALIPRPEQTPEALRSALAVVAPGLLEKMQTTKDEAFAKAVEWQSLSPVQSWVLIWAKEIEIARRRDLSARYAQATQDLEHEEPAIAQEGEDVLPQAVAAHTGKPDVEDEVQGIMRRPDVMVISEADMETAGTFDPRTGTGAVLTDIHPTPYGPRYATRKDFVYGEDVTIGEWTIATDGLPRYQPSGQ